MPALTEGTLAPEISAPTLRGKNFSLHAALKRGPVLAAFFKISCPVCQLTLPYVERIFRAYPGTPVTIVGISEDEREYTDAFARDYGITFPLVLEDTNRYPVSNDYDLTNVPTLFFIDPSGEIKQTVVGWSKRDMEKLNAEVARASGSAPKPMFGPGEDVADFKAG